jgi:hypothetical protein
MDADTEICWESAFDSGDVVVNDGEVFKVKAVK